jgi:TRAP transporter 4TM/12TM fusion protein
VKRIDSGRTTPGFSISTWLVAALSIAWALFQLALPRFIILDSITVRAIHLAFAIILIFLTVSARRRKRSDQFVAAWSVSGGPDPADSIEGASAGSGDSAASAGSGDSAASAGSEHPAAPAGSRHRIAPLDYVLAAIGCLAALYIVFDWTGIMMRSGLPTARDIALSILLIVLVLEASRRVIGPALAIIAVFFTVYAFLGPYMPSIFAFRGVSMSKYISQVVLGTEGIYGIPLDVSANTVFLFVLLGSMLDRAGAGHFYNDLAISLLGKYKGGPAKAAVVSSGLTGLVSGSSIANVVTTGTFTIPLMKKVGYPPRVAAATEVAASTNGQLMPPIMGAAAFIIAEYLSVPYLDVVKAAAIPAFVSYFALFYITHLEASKLGMSGLPKAEIPAFAAVMKRGFYYLIPLVALIYELIVMRHTPKLAAFNAIVVLMVIIMVKEIASAIRNQTGLVGALKRGLRTIGLGLNSGSRNMLSVAIATATAGIVVGIVNLGIGSLIVQVVEVISGGSIFLLLLITAVASLVIGMGLPTTATYIVMASITVPVIIKLSALGVVGFIPAISAHLFCFYFGILADDTPPVGLAAYAAAAIAGSDPIPTGVKGFMYDLRTAVIPFMFVFNAELVLYGVDSFAKAMLIFLMAILGAFAFTNAVQGWFLTRNKWYEVPLYLIASVILFYPAIITRIFDLDPGLRYYMYLAGLAVYALAYLIQRSRIRASLAA